MCGIYGAINFADKVSKDKIIKFSYQAESSLIHRGPDGSNSVYIDDNILLGHTRLSIIDIDGGTQPMTNESQSIWLTFNGEIYNYIEIKNDLRHRGYNFLTSSDSEVIIALYEFYGMDMFEHLNGMFAFCLYDKTKNKTILARDRFGEKPLYYSFFNNQLIFSSELKALKLFPGVNLDKDYKALGQFLSLGYIPAPRTHFKSIKKLGPSQCLVFVGDNKIKIDKYWTLKPKGESRIKSSDAIDKLKVLLIDSLKIRLRSDVPLAGFLSGGIDSTLVCSLIKDHFNKDLKTICVSFDSELLDESKYASIVAKLINSSHVNSVYDIQSVNSDFKNLVDHIDEPFGDYSIFPTSQACKVAKELGYTVMLSGDGADEIFGGYSNWYRHYNFAFLKKIKSINILSNFFLKHYSKRGAGILKTLSDDGSIGLNSENLFFYKFINHDLCSKILEGINELNDRFVKYNLNQFPKNHMDSSLFEFYLPEQVLVKVDRASMYNAIESRTPFLDYRLIEYANRLPVRLHYHSNSGKALLRKMLPSKIPNEIRWRQKRGFTPPLSDWFRLGLKTQIKNSIRKVSRSHIAKRDNNLISILNEHLEGKDNTQELFKWFMVSEKFLD